jgi:hypothetical protein
VTDRSDGYVGMCALCLHIRKLCNSHIVPEFAYRPIYDSKHRAIAFNPRAPDVRQNIQKGLRSRLLCENCEGIINTHYESTFKRFWFDDESLSKAMQGTGRIVKVDYASFKLFHLSVLWRASLSTHEAFKQVAIGKEHTERIRQMLLDKDPGPVWQYPILCEGILGPNGPSTNLFVSPQRSQYQRHRVYQFTFCGCRWLYFISSQPVNSAERLGLKDSGELPVGKCEIKEVLQSIHQATQKIRMSRRTAAVH